LFSTSWTSVEVLMPNLSPACSKWFQRAKSKRAMWFLLL
jgi:hypothetical protein